MSEGRGAIVRLSQECRGGDEFDSGGAAQTPAQGRPSTRAGTTTTLPLRGESATGPTPDHKHTKYLYSVTRSMVRVEQELNYWVGLQ